MDTDDEDDEDLEDSDEDGYASSGPGPLTLVMDHTWAVNELTRSTKRIAICASLLPRPLAHSFRALKESIIKFQRYPPEGKKMTLLCLELAGREEIEEDDDGNVSSTYRMTYERAEDYPVEADDWTAFADLVTSVPSLQDLWFRFENLPSTTLPPSFLLSIRQHSFDLRITLDPPEHQADFIATLLQQHLEVEQQQQTGVSLISPFALGSVRVDQISQTDIASLVRLGRCGPERVLFWNHGVFDESVRSRGEEQESLETLLALLEKNMWIEWNDPGSLFFRARGFRSLGRMPGEEELLKKVEAVQKRVVDRRFKTRMAAPNLLRAARTLLLCSSSLPTPHLDSYKPHPPPTSSISDQPVAHISTTTSPSSSIAPPTSGLVSPILSVPFDILDIILSSLYPGFLSSNQHRLVMKWAMDRSTLGVNKADSRTDFLRKSNCWKWESEVERVNLGLGYE